MATPREIRRLAFQTLYQIDARGGEDAEVIREALENATEFTTNEQEKALTLANGAYENRKESDKEMKELAPDWPAYRQAAVDRAILRLAHYEMTGTDTNPKIVVNEAVELAKQFSTDKSPAFINGLLDKVLKRVLQAEPPVETESDALEESDA